MADISSNRLPLEHVRAVVLTQAWAGAFTTRLLADMGAEVVQIESLDRPDPWRGGYPPRLSGTYPNDEPGERPYNRNAAFNSVNTNKLGITLDLNTEEGKRILLDLVSISDIFAENFSARVIPNFGLEYPVLREINPSIVMLRMPSYGCYGPYSTYMGNGGTTEPMSGISSLLGYENGPPMNSGFMHTDPLAGMMAFGALLTALHHRARTGEGQMIDLSQQETSITLIADKVIDYAMNGTVPERAGNRLDAMVPHGNFRCEGDDAWVAIAIRSDDEWRRLCGAMDMDSLSADPRFTTLKGRRERANEIDQLVSTWTANLPPYMITGVLQREGIACAPVLKAHELPDNPQLSFRGFFERVDHPETGAFLHAGTPWKMSRSPSRNLDPAPGIGQHSVRVLTEIVGLPMEEVERLVVRGITGDTPDLDE